MNTYVAHTSQRGHPGNTELMQNGQGDSGGPEAVDFERAERYDEAACHATPQIVHSAALRNQSALIRHRGRRLLWQGMWSQKELPLLNLHIRRQVVYQVVEVEGWRGCARAGAVWKHHRRRCEEAEEIEGVDPVEVAIQFRRQNVLHAQEIRCSATAVGDLHECIRAWDAKVLKERGNH